MLKEDRKKRSDFVLRRFEEREGGERRRDVIACHMNAIRTIGCLKVTNSKTLVSLFSSLSFYTNEIPFWLSSLMELELELRKKRRKKRKVWFPL